MQVYLLVFVVQKNLHIYATQFDMLFVYLLLETIFYMAKVDKREKFIRKATKKFAIIIFHAPLI